MTFRSASPAEPEAHALLGEYFAERAAGFPGGSYRPAAPDPEVFAPPRGVLLVASDQHGDVGIGGIRRLDDGPVEARFEVKHLYTRPAARGFGTAGALLRELERRARAWGAKELVLDTHHTLTAAAALYAVNGFTPIEAYNDNANATVWLRKALG